MRVSLAGVVKSYGAQPVLDRVDLTLGPRSRLGVVGPNGAGKSTLLRLLAGIEEPDEGSVERTPATLSAGYLPQEHDRRPGETLFSYLARRTGVADADAEVAAAQRKVEPGRLLGRAGALPRARRRRPRAPGEDGLRRARSAGLARPGDDHALGRRGRPRGARRDPALALRRAPARRADERPRLQRPRLLERFLAGFQGGLAVVSHDRAFLDRTVTGSRRSTPGRARSASSPAAGRNTSPHESWPARRQYEAFERSRNAGARSRRC